MVGLGWPELFGSFQGVDDGFRRAQQLGLCQPLVYMPRAPCGHFCEPRESREMKEAAENSRGSKTKRRRNALILRQKPPQTYKNVIADWGRSLLSLEANIESDTTVYRGAYETCFVWQPACWDTQGFGHNASPEATTLDIDEFLDASRMIAPQYFVEIAGSYCSWITE